VSPIIEGMILWQTIFVRIYVHLLLGLFLWIIHILSVVLLVCAASSPSGVWGGAPAEIEFGAF